MNEAGSPAAMAVLRREAMACRNVSRPSVVRVISTCGAPPAVFPSFPSGSASRFSSPAATVPSRTFTGVSSAASTSSPARAAGIASSNPAFPGCALTRAAALSTKPAETGTPSSIAMTCADRSGGTFP